MIAAQMRYASLPPRDGLTGWHFQIYVSNDEGNPLLVIGMECEFWGPTIDEHHAWGAAIAYFRELGYHVQAVDAKAEHA